MKNNNKLNEYKSKIENNLDEVITEINDFFLTNSTKNFQEKFGFSWGSVSSLLLEKNYRLEKGQLIKQQNKKEETKPELSYLEIMLLKEFADSLKAKNILTKNYKYDTDSKMSIRLDAEVKEELEKLYTELSFLKRTDILNECLMRGIRSMKFYNNMYIK